MRKFTAEEVNHLVWEQELKRIKGENRRWSRSVYSIVETDDKKVYGLCWEQGLTESQEDEYEAQEAEELVLVKYESNKMVAEYMTVEQSKKYKKRPVSSNFKLYEIAEGIAWSMDNIDDEETKEGTLELLEDELKHKSVSLIHVNNEFKRKNDTIQAEIDRLKELQSSNNKDHDKFLGFIEYSMNKIGSKKIVTDLGTITTSKSVSTNVDETKLPKEYFITKTIPAKKETKAMSKAELKKLVQDGKVIDGVTLVEKLNVKFK